MRDWRKEPMMNKEKMHGTVVRLHVEGRGEIGRRARCIAEWTSASCGNAQRGRKEERARDGEKVGKCGKV